MLFISHSSKDAEYAGRIVSFLEGRGIACWIAPRDIVPGATFPAQIMKAIRECDGFVLVASGNVNQSNHINSEVARAFDFGKSIYPFLIDRVEFSDDYLYYLGQIQWINAYESFQDGLEALLTVIGQNGGEGRPARASGRAAAPAPVQPAAGGEVRIATYRDLTMAGCSALDIANRLVENDYRLYPGMVVENEGEPEQWAEYLSTYPDTFRYLVNERNEIIGNWSFLAVSEALHAEKLAAGELTEETFRIDETEYLLFPGDYIGYLLNLSLNEGYNSARNLNMLLQAFVEQLLTFAEDGIFFKAWYVNVFRKDHEAMYRRLGFSYFQDNIRFGKLYHLSCIPPSREPQRKRHSDSPVFVAGKRLMELYYDHFVQQG